MFYEQQAILLAGGNGSRMGELTRNTQKCLLPIDEKPTLLHIIDGLVDEFGSLDLKIVTGYQADSVKDFVDHNLPPNVRASCHYFTPGTEGWGIYYGLRDEVDGRFVAAPGDIIAEPHAYSDVLTLQEQSLCPVAMTMSPYVDLADTHGIGLIDKGLITHLDWSDKRLVVPEPGLLRDMTIWSATPEVFDMLEQYPAPNQSIGVSFMRAFNEGVPFAGNNYRGHWIHIGYPEDLQRTMHQNDLEAA